MTKAEVVAHKVLVLEKALLNVLNENSGALDGCLIYHRYIVQTNISELFSSW